MDSKFLKTVDVKELDSIIKQFNAAGVTDKKLAKGKNVEESLNNFFDAIEALDDDAVDNLPDEIVEYYNTMVQAAGLVDEVEVEEPDTDDDDEDDEEETPPPAAKKESKPAKKEEKKGKKEKEEKPSKAKEEPAAKKEKPAPKQEEKPAKGKKAPEKAEEAPEKPSKEKGKGKDEKKGKSQEKAKVKEEKAAPKKAEKKKSKAPKKSKTSPFNAGSNMDIIYNLLMRPEGGTMRDIIMSTKLDRKRASSALGYIKERGYVIKRDDKDAYRIVATL